MQTELGKWGNSIALRIPAKVVKDMGVTAGSSVEITQKGNQLILTPSKPKKISRKERLARMIADLDKYGPDELLDWGPDVGREIVEW